MTVAPQSKYRYFDLVMVAFVVVLVCSNLIGPAKAATLDLPLIGAVTFGAGVLFFPVSYIFGDILTEVYGYDRARLEACRERGSLRPGHEFQSVQGEGIGFRG